MMKKNLLQLDDSDALIQDLRAIATASRDLGFHAMGVVAVSAGHFGFLRWLATIAAIFLVAVDRTNWRTDLLTGLLVPYIWLNLPPILFGFLRGEVGKWISLIGIIVRLFFPHKFPMDLELPLALTLLLVTGPNLLVHYVREGVAGVIVSLIIGGYLLQQHIRNAGGFKNAFAAQRGIPNTVGILLLFVSPLWELIRHYL